MFSTLENGEIVNGLAGFPNDGPTLLVGYHLLTGVELVPLVASIFEQKNIIIRGLAHPILFTKSKDAKYFDFAVFDPFRVMGAVPVSGVNLFKLLASKSHVLLYPGGMREACHRKVQKLYISLFLCSTFSVYKSAILFFHCLQSNVFEV